MNKKDFKNKENPSFILNSEMNSQIDYYPLYSTNHPFFEIYCELLSSNILSLTIEFSRETIRRIENEL